MSGRGEERKEYGKESKDAKLAMDSVGRGRRVKENACVGKRECRDRLREIRSRQHVSTSTLSCSLLALHAYLLALSRHVGVETGR